MLLLVRDVNHKEVDKSKRLQKIPNKYRQQVEARLVEISKQIQHKRESMGLTQEELAEELGISNISLQFIEQGRRYPSVQMLFYICVYLKLDIKFK